MSIFNESSNERYRLFAKKIHTLGERPLFELFIELQNGGILENVLESYSKLSPHIKFIENNGGRNIVSTTRIPLSQDNHINPYESDIDWLSTNATAKMLYMQINFHSLNQAAISSLPAILSRILPQGKIVGSEYISRNPTRSDRNSGSFKVNIRNGKWADFATGDCGGDIISLVAYLENISQVSAASLLKQILGLKNG